MAKLPSKIYIIDPYDEDGNLVPNTEDVCWCADPVGDENIAYIAEQTVTEALAALRAKLNASADPDGVNTQWNMALDYVETELDTTIAALGLAPKEDNGNH